MINWSDIINGLWEVFGAVIIIPSIKSVLKEKKVAGVNWATVGFFSAWGLWNIIFYPLNGLIFSFVGGVLLLIMNSIWVLLLIKYRK